MKLHIRRKGNPTRPWCVKQGPIVLANFPTWGEAVDFTGRYLAAFEVTS